MIRDDFFIELFFTKTPVFRKPQSEKADTFSGTDVTHLIYKIFLPLCKINFSFECFIL